MIQPKKSKFSLLPIAKVTTSGSGSPRKIFLTFWYLRQLSLSTQPLYDAGPS